jgi:hypothetical protein
MVHALHAVRGVLRAQGALISITPERFDARIAVLSGSHRLPAGKLVNPSFDRYLLAAEAALDRVVRDGSFALEGKRHHRYHNRLRHPSELPEYIDLLGTPRPRLSRGTWPRLRALWASRGMGARIEIMDGLVITALRRTSPPAASP